MFLFLTVVACNSEGKVDNNIISEEPIDVDGDGFSGNDDCDDDNPAVHIGATEICDGTDNNCDGNIDENVQTTYYLDEDGDGFGTSTDTLEACSAPDDYVLISNDCDDQNPDIYPGTDKQCEEMRTTFCASGGRVSGDTVHGVFCFAPLDAAAGPKSSNGNLTWQPGPFTNITPQ